MPFRASSSTKTAPPRARRHLSALLLLLVAAACSGRPAGAAPSRPSIVLITIDTLRPDHLGLYGAAHNTSPFLDSLAAGGIVFERAWSTSSWTVPSVVSLMTGVYPTSHGVVHGAVVKGKLSLQEAIPASLPVLPELLKKLGYRTYGITANHHMNADLGFARGFDRYRCLGFAPGDEVSAAVLDWKDEITRGDGPFFLWIHYFDPHRTYHAREPWIHEFLPDADGAELDRVVAMQDQWFRVEDQLKASPRVLDVARALYDSEIRYFDEQLRALYAALPLDGAWTMITADHGEEFLEHGYLGHSRNLYDQTMRIPMMIRPPGGGAAARVSDPVSLVDAPSTILSAAGGTPPRGWNGAILWTREGGAAVPDRPFLMGELDRTTEESGLRVMIEGPWKLIARIGTASTELYDLDADPGETKNRSPHERERAQRMRQDLLRALRALPAPPSRVETRPLDKDTEERLRSLGYIH